MFESKTDAVISRRAFVRRLIRSASISFGIVALSLFVGTLGYHVIAEFPWIDAFLNASMILTGMGPLGQLPSTPAKLFAAFYALFSGIIFLTVMTVTFAPLLHRILHSFHVDDDDDIEDDK